MPVGIDKSRQQRAPPEIDHLSIVGDQGQDIL